MRLFDVQIFHVLVCNSCSRRHISKSRSTVQHMSSHTQAVSIKLERCTPAVSLHSATLRTPSEVETHSHQFPQRQDIVTHLSKSECGRCFHRLFTSCRSHQKMAQFSFCCISFSLRRLRSGPVGIKSANFGVHRCSSVPVSKRSDLVDHRTAHMFETLKHQPVDASSLSISITKSSTFFTAATSPSSSAEAAAEPPFDSPSAMRFLQSARLCSHILQYPQYPWTCFVLVTGF